MQLLLRSALAATGFAALALPALAQTNTMDNMHNAMSKTSLNIVIGQENGSGQKGSATISDVSGGVKVVLSLSGEPSGATEPAHIHRGTCANLNPVPYKALTSVVGGKSTSMVAGVTVAAIKSGRYAINVHKSAAELKHYVACGDL